MKNWSMKDIEREVRGRTEMLEYMKWKESQASRQHPFTHRDVGRLVSFYYKEPQQALAEARAEMERGRGRAA